MCRVRILDEVASISLRVNALRKGMDLCFFPTSLGKIVEQTRPSSFGRIVCLGKGKKIWILNRRNVEKSLTSYWYSGPLLSAHPKKCIRFYTVTCMYLPQSSVTGRIGRTISFILDWMPTKAKGPSILYYLSIDGGRRCFGCPTTMPIIHVYIL